MTQNNENLSDDLNALSWQVDMGIDEVISEKPINRFEPAKKAPAKKAVARQPERPAIIKPDMVKPASPTIAEADAETLAAAANSLEELEKVIQDFEGCSLKKTAMNTVFARGDVSSKLMLIGEAPGGDEDRQGKPFVGASGKLLDKMMAAIGLEVDSGYYISNILPWRPPGNRKPTPQEQTICLPFIKRHIELADPDLLVFLGGTAVSALLNISDGITRVRGRWYSYPVGKKTIPAMATFHPAYLLRQPQLKRQSWQDLLEIKAKLRG
ncbi:MAG: uracil-DNA glycosylase [Sphingomonadales bacterium]